MHCLLDEKSAREIEFVNWCLLAMVSFLFLSLGAAIARGLQHRIDVDVSTPTHTVNPLFMGYVLMFLQLLVYSREYILLP